MTVCVATEPDVMVCVKVMTVVGILAGGAVGAGGWAPPVGGDEGAAGADGVGMSVMELGTPVQILLNVSNGNG